jgi:hypothetical protein
MQDVFKNENNYNAHASFIAASKDETMAAMFKLALRDRKLSRQDLNVIGSGSLPADFDFMSEAA